ncbi:MAG: BtrH N-terminal domain-containing protein [Planctomycetes bacterium]|nr:BtrH N-terminal domain-containing protein [Planctomycetota bacterium]
MTSIAFQHQHAAHCESGAISSIFRHGGLNISEAMAFGLGTGLAFAYFPFIRMGGVPLTSYRIPPGGIIRRLTNKLNAPLIQKRYKNAVDANADLKKMLDEGKIVGCQSSVYWLPYFPPHMRFHFNAHNLVVYGYEGDEYLISDPIAEMPVRCNEVDLNRARFATGLFAPKGRCYQITDFSKIPPLENLVTAAIKKTSKQMTGAPIPYVGTWGMRTLAKKIKTLSAHRNPQKAHLFLGSVVRMQEEIGTGGAGFRFLYSAFLQEAYEMTGHKDFKDASKMMTEAGDTLREFALKSARIIKSQSHEGYEEAADTLTRAAHAEESIHKFLLKADV